MESTDPSMVESLAAIVPDARQILTGQYETPVLRRWYMKAVARYRELYGYDSPAFKEFYALRQDFLRDTVSPATIKAKVSEFLSLAESLIEGRLGKERVLILLKHGTKIYSDFDGVSQVRFRDDVHDIFIQLQDELRAAQLIESLGRV